MKLKPLHDWAVIRPSAADERTAGGLHIPDTAKQKPEQGVVESIGPGAYEQEKYGKKKKEQKERKFIPTTVKPGDHVLFERYAGQTYDTGAEELILVRERDILGLLPEGPVRPRFTESPRRIPAATSSQAQTAIAKTGPKAIAERPEAKAVKKAVPESAEPAPKPAAKAPKASLKKAAIKQGAGGKGQGSKVKASAGKPSKPTKTKKAAAKKTGKKK
ncbi:MAG: co-chaperone GroES [Nitrospirota bacterium]|mgnify:CR=1 FL=1